MLVTEKITKFCIIVCNLVMTKIQLKFPTQGRESSTVCSRGDQQVYGIAGCAE